MRRRSGYEENKVYRSDGSKYISSLFDHKFFFVMNIMKRGEIMTYVNKNGKTTTYDYNDE